MLAIATINIITITLIVLVMQSRKNNKRFTIARTMLLAGASVEEVIAECAVEVGYGGLGNAHTNAAIKRARKSIK